MYAYMYVCIYICMYVCATNVCSTHECHESCIKYYPCAYQAVNTGSSPYTHKNIGHTDTAHTLSFSRITSFSLNTALRQGIAFHTRIRSAGRHASQNLSKDSVPSGRSTGTNAMPTISLQKSAEPSDGKFSIK